MILPMHAHASAHKHVREHICTLTLVPEFKDMPSNFRVNGDFCKTKFLTAAVYIPI
jgi:hypothetical protein